MRSFDDKSKKPDLSPKEIPDFEGAAKGLQGVKAPFSYRQTCDIQDRLMASGLYRQQQPSSPKNG